MEFIYKIRHKKSGLYLDDRNLLSEDGIIYKKIPTFSLDKRLADGTETKYSDWEFVQCAVIIHETIETKPYSWFNDGEARAMDKADTMKALKQAFAKIMNADARRQPLSRRLELANYSCLPNLAEDVKVEFTTQKGHSFQDCLAFSTAESSLMCKVRFALTYSEEIGFTDQRD